MVSRRLIAPCVGALAWIAVIVSRLWSVDDSFWIARDDAIITLSHARNAAQFGSIGVSPGGDRVEGFSSPLHFALAYVLQLGASPGYRAITLVIIIGTIAGAGIAVVIGLRSIAQQAGLAAGRADTVAVGLAVAVAVVVAASWTSVGWIGSGMENPTVICSGLAVVAAAVVPIRPRVGQIALVATLGLLMVSRVEFAAFSGPLVVVTAWMNASRWPAERRRLAFAQTVGATLVLVGSVHAVRRMYFGEWLPNTARVQGRATALNEVLLIGVIAAVVTVFFAIAVISMSTSTAEWRTSLSLALSLAAAVLIVAFLWMHASGRTAGSVLSLLLLQPIIPLLILVLALLQLQRFSVGTPWLPNHVFAALVAVPLGQYVATGPARLDDFRIAVIAVPFLATWAAALIVVVASSPPPGELPSTFHHRFARSGAFGIGAAVLVLGTGWIFVGDRARPLNYEITGAPAIVDVVHRVRDQQLDGAGLVILANPDVGKVSFDKSAVMVDLGLLGDPLLALIDHERPELVDIYLGVVARPDVLESHSGWSCKFGGWLDSQDFADNYELSDEAWLEGRAQAVGCLLDGRWAIWTRTDADAEYALTRDLLQSDDPAGVVRAALIECDAGGDDVFRCAGVRRSLQRAAATLRSEDTFAAAIETMINSPSAALDIPMLERGSNWAPEAFDAFVELVETTPSNR